MIKYTLSCPKGHIFESWFSNSADFDRLSDAGHLSCAFCGSGDVAKAMMAPRVATSDAAPQIQDQGQALPATNSDAPLSTPSSPAEEVLRALKSKIETEAEDVGRNFASEARAIHEGEAPGRAIYGEARAADAKALIEDGVQIAPLPFIPKRKTS